MPIFSSICSCGSSWQCCRLNSRPRIFKISGSVRSGLSLQCHAHPVFGNTFCGTSHWYMFLFWNMFQKLIICIVLSQEWHVLKRPVCHLRLQASNKQMPNRQCVSSRPMVLLQPAPTALKMVSRSSKETNQHPPRTAFSSSEIHDAIDFWSGRLTCIQRIRPRERHEVSKTSSSSLDSWVNIVTGHFPRKNIDFIS